MFLYILEHIPVLITHLFKMEPATIAALAAAIVSLSTTILTAFGSYLLKADFEEIICCCGACDFMKKAAVVERSERRHTVIDVIPEKSSI